MNNANVAYDTRSGRIISVHIRVSNESIPEASYAHTNVDQADTATITVTFGEWDSAKRYRVDVDRKELVEVEADEDGVTFGFGTTGCSH